jgi:hypothetical protein
VLPVEDRLPILLEWVCFVTIGSGSRALNGFKNGQLDILEYVLYFVNLCQSTVLGYEVGNKELDDKLMLVTRVRKS